MNYKIAISRYKLNHKIPGGSEFWGTFNASFDNLELDTETIMQTVYDGRAMTTQHTKNWRHSNNYLAGQVIGLDFDNEDDTCRLDNLVKDKFISTYAAFAHTTISHTDEKPRARVVFCLDTPIMQAKNYVLAASSLLWVFGSADRACKDAARFFYGAPKCDFEFLDNVLPIETVKKLIVQYQETGKAEKKQAVRPDYIAPPTQQEVQDALRVIPAWGITYDEWVTVLMGIHSEFGEDGYSLAESWGSGAQGEIERKWKSFNKSGNEIGFVTIASVFGIAKRFGWTKSAYCNSPADAV